MILSVTIPGKPQAKERARRGKGGFWYTPTATRNFERRVKLFCIFRRVRSWPLDARYSVTLGIYMPDRRRRDLDNVAKSVLDGCNGVLWDDDTQVDVLTLTKHLDRERPRVELTAETL